MVTGPEEKVELTKSQRKEMLQGARAAWDQCYSDQIQSKKNWQRIAFCEAALLGLAIWGSIHLGAMPKRVAYVVEKDKYGHIIYAGDLKEQPLTDQVWDQIYTDALHQHVEDWRTVTSDKTAQDAQWDRAYKHGPLSVGVGSQAKRFLDEWYSTNNPDDRAAKGNITRVEIDATDRLGDCSYGISWTEVEYGTNGEVVSNKKYRCVYTFVKVDDLHFRVTEMRLQQLHAESNS